MSQPVLFSSTFADAPQITNVDGSWCDVFKACLITGFHSVSVTSFVVTDGLGVAQTSGAHGFSHNPLVRISGANEGALNADWRMLYQNSTTEFVVSCPGVPNMTGTGTMAALRAPVPGWEMPFESASVKVFRSTDLSGPRPFFRLSDGTNFIRCEAKTGMTTIDDGVSLHAMAIGKFYNNYYSPKWFLAADSKTIYSGHMLYQGISRLAYVPFFFGDHATYMAGDSFPTLMGAGQDVLNLNNRVELFKRVGTSPVLAAPFDVHARGVVTGRVGMAGSTVNPGAAGPSFFPIILSNGASTSVTAQFPIGHLRGIVAPHQDRSLLPGDLSGTWMENGNLLFFVDIYVEQSPYNGKLGVIGVGDWG